MLGLKFECVPSGAPEPVHNGETPGDTVLRLAAAKAQMVAKDLTGDVLVVAGDTLVATNGDVLGQPDSPEQAAAMLSRLSDSSHYVYTGVALIRPGRAPATGLSRSEVRFYPMSREEIEWYVATGEPMDKAGAYAAQGIGAVFIRSIEGSFFNVMGFPVDLFYRLLPEVGLDLQELRLRPNGRRSTEVGS